MATRSTGSKRRAGVRALFAAIAVALITALSGLTLAQPAAGPARLPSGYTVAHETGTRWLFPLRAKAEVDDLRSSQRSVWRQLGYEFGMVLPPDLDIRVARNPDDMQALAPAGQALPTYATGVAFPAQGLILVSLTEPESWVRPDMRRLLIHELAHVALDRATHGHEVPRWFSEGIAVNEADEHSLDRVRTLWEGTLSGQLIALPQLTSSFPARHGEVNLAYAEAADLVGHMLAGDPSRKHLRTLLAKLREGQDFEQAVLIAYHLPLWQLEQNWRAALTQRFGRLPSILAGLTAVWGLGALLLVVGYVRVRRRHHQTLQRWAIEEAPILAAPPTHLPPPPPPPRNAADEVLDAWSEQRRREAEIPTVVHDGRSHTLH